MTYYITLIMQLGQPQPSFANRSQAPVESGWTLVTTVTCDMSWVLTLFCSGWLTRVQLVVLRQPVGWGLEFGYAYRTRLMSEHWLYYVHCRSVSWCAVCAVYVVSLLAVVCSLFCVHCSSAGRPCCVRCRSGDWHAVSSVYIVGPAAGLQSPDLTSSARMSQPVSRSSPQHVQSHAQSVRVPGGLSQHTADVDNGLSAVICCCFVIYKLK